MVFRKAKEQDAIKLDNLLTKLIEDEVNYDNEVEIVNVKDFYINYIYDPTKYIYLCEENSKVIGYIYAIINDDNAKIDALFVDNKYRNRHIATKLIEDFILYAKDNNIKTITINVLKDNIKAKNLYSKYFRVYKTENKKEELIMEVSDFNEKK